MNRTQKHENPTIEKKIEDDIELAYSICFSPDQKKMCGSTGERIKIWDLASFKFSQFIGHTDGINTVDYSPNGKFIVSSSDDCTIRIWDCETPSGNNVALEGHTEWVNHAVFFNGEKEILSGGGDRTIKKWNIERKEVIKSISCEDYDLKPPWSMDILPNDQTFCCGIGSKVILYDFRTEKCVHTFDKIHTKDVFSVDLHPDSFLLASAGLDKTINICDIRTYKLLQTYQKHTNCVYAIDFHPSGKYLISGSIDETINFFDVLEKKHLYCLKEYGAMDVQFSPEGDYFASVGGYAGRGEVIILWNSGIPRKQPLWKVDLFERALYINKFMWNNYNIHSGGKDVEQINNEGGVFSVYGFDVKISFPKVFLLL